MSTYTNGVANTNTTNVVPVQGTFDQNNNVINLVGPGGKTFNPAVLSFDANGNPTSIINNKGGYTNFSSLYTKLIESQLNAKGKNPFDFTSSATQSLVSAVTVDAAAYSNPVSYGYFDAGGYDRFHICGIPYKDTSLMVTNASGYIATSYPSNSSGSGFGGMSFAQNQIGGQLLMAKVTCSSLQVNINNFGLSSNYTPIYINGVSVVPSVASNPTTNLQVAFAARGTYDIAVGFEQSLTIKGITIDGDDTIAPLTDVRLPVVVYGDSYTTGTTSPQTIGGLSLCGALSFIGGINAIPQGVTGTGYVADLSSTGIPLTYLPRLQYLVNVVNAANAPLIIIPAGWNDVSAAASTSAVQIAATNIANYLLANTSANIIMFGAQPGKWNNSAAVQAVDAGIANAVTAINNNRLAFVPESGAIPAWITGTRDTAHTTGLVTGNSRYYTGNDGIHLSPYQTTVPPSQANTTPSSGVEYMARKILDGITQTALIRNW